MLTPEQQDVLSWELSKPDYDGMTAAQAYKFLHDSTPDCPPRMVERFRGSVLRAAGIPTCLGVEPHPKTGQPHRVSLSMPNAFDEADFFEAFTKARPGQ